MFTFFFFKYSSIRYQMHSSFMMLRCVVQMQKKYSIEVVIASLGFDMIKKLGNELRRSDCFSWATLVWYLYLLRKRLSWLIFHEAERLRAEKKIQFKLPRTGHVIRVSCTDNYPKRIQKRTPLSETINFIDCLQLWNARGLDRMDGCWQGIFYVYICTRGWNRSRLCMQRKKRTNERDLSAEKIIASTKSPRWSYRLEGCKKRFHLAVENAPLHSAPAI